LGKKGKVTTRDEIMTVIFFKNDMKKFYGYELCISLVTPKTDEIVEKYRFISIGN
jgi:hypothetical protein